jgi:uncharacterized membrane protein YphA (DoxX/SURF4 family)
MTEASPKRSTQPEERAEAPDRFSKVRYWLAEKLPAVGAILVGSVFVLAGGLKVFDPLSFYSQIRGYGLVGPELSRIAAFALPPFEVGIGLAAIVGYHRRLACLAIAGMLVVFLAATAHAWVTSSTDNCGCFGELVSRSPKETFFEDIALLALAVGGLWSKSGLEEVHRSKIPRWIKTAAVVGVVGAGFVLSYRYGALDIRAGGELRSGLEASGWAITELEAPGYEPKDVSINLKKGTHILVFYSPLCKHCYQSVATVEGLSDLPGVETVVGLSHDRHRPEMFEFFIRGMKERGADYPLVVMPWKDYRTLNRTVPKTVVVKTGMVRMVIPGVPTAKELGPYLK